MKSCKFQAVKVKVNGVQQSATRYGNSHVIRDHTELPAIRQRWHSRHYPSRSWYSIKRPLRGARPSWPVKYWDGIPAEDGHPSRYYPGPTRVNFVYATNPAVLLTAWFSLFITRSVSGSGDTIGCVRLSVCFLNEWIFYSSTQIQYSKNSKEQNCVDWKERLKSTYNCPKRYVNEETHCTKTKH